MTQQQPSPWIAAIRDGAAAVAPPAGPADALVAELYAAATEAVRSDYAAARRLTDAALSIAVSESSPRARGLAFRCDAVLLWAANHYPEALERFEAALAEFEQAGDELESARTRSNAIQTLIYLSRYDQAASWTAAAREVFARHGDELRMARLDGNAANLLYRQDRFEEAIELYEDVEARFRRVGETRDVAAVLRNKAVCQLSLSRFDDALCTHREARAVSLAHGLTNLVAETDYNIAYLHFLRGDYLRARALYATARAAAVESGDRYHSALCDLDEAELLLELNLAEDAEELAKDAARAFRRLGLGYEAAKAEVIVALCAGGQGNVTRALRLLRKARKHFSSEQNAIWPPLIDLYSALLLDKAGEAGKAREKCRTALGFFSAAVFPGKAIHCRLLLARIDLQLGQLRSAAAHAAAAERLLPHAQSPALAGHTWHMSGRIQEAQANYDSAFDFYERSRREFEGLRERLRTEELRISFFKDKVAVYESHFELLIERGQIAEAFQTAERAKSRNLAGLITPRRSPGQTSPGGETREQLDRLYRELETAESSFTTEDTRRVLQIRARIKCAEAEVRKQLSNEVAASGVSEPGVEWVLSQIPKDATLVEYFEARGKLYAFTAGAGRLAVHPLGAIERVSRAARFLRFHLEGSRFAPGNATSPDLIAHLRSLHDELWAPLGESIATPHCIVIPHGFLHSLPFHALHNGDQFLGERYTFSSAPSAAVFCQAMRGRPLLAAPTVAVFGVADSLAPGIAGECRQVAAIFDGAQLFLDSDATVEQLQRSGQTCSILHVATHGRFRRDNPWFSSIRMGDGYLNLYDLYETRLRAELVVLSGCSTGLNVVLGGDEIVGLVRGLLHGGAGGAMVSLWDVNDESTALLMNEFYRRVANGEDLAIALQAAQARTRERFPNPFHWAAFALMGRYDAIQKKNRDENAAASIF